MYKPVRDIIYDNGAGCQEIHYDIPLESWHKWLAIHNHYAYIALQALYRLCEQLLSLIGKELRVTFETLILEADLRQWDKRYGTSMYAEYVTSRRNSAIAKKRQERDDRMQALGL